MLPGLLPGWGDLDPSGTVIVWIAKSPDQAKGIKLADDPGQHGGVKALDLSELGEAEGTSVGNEAKYGRLGGSQPLPYCSGVQLSREPKNHTPQADHAVGVHTYCPCVRRGLRIRQAQPGPVQKGQTLMRLFPSYRR